MEGPFKFCLGPLEIQMVGALDPQQKMSTESPVDVSCWKLGHVTWPWPCTAKQPVRSSVIGDVNVNIDWSDESASLFWSFLAIRQCHIWKNIWHCRIVVWHCWIYEKWQSSTKIVYAVYFQPVPNRHEIAILSCLLALKFDRRLGSNAAQLFSYIKAIRVF